MDIKEFQLFWLDLLYDKSSNGLNRQDVEKEF